MTTTPNQTAESVIAEAMVNAGAPLMHSRVEEAVAGALRKAGMLVERSEQVCAWCPSPARGSAHHNDGKLHPSCGQTNHGQGWVPDYPVERIGAIEAEPDAATERVAELEAERDELEDRLSKYLCDSTGGLLSKTGYDVRTMVAHTEDYYDGLHADARKEIEAERDAALAECRTLRGERNTFEDDLAKEIDRANAALAAVERAEARIAELEQSLRIEALAREVNGTLLHEYERRFAESAKLHQPFEWSFGYGPVKSCSGCADRGVPQEKAEWPCPTAIALGLNEGENDE